MTNVFENDITFTYVENVFGANELQGLYQFKLNQYINQ